MLTIGYKHTLDIEKFIDWNEKHDHDSYNGLKNFLLEERHRKLFFRGIISESSFLFGETKFWFSEQKYTARGIFDVTIWLWNESLQYFSPILPSKQEEMDV